MINIEPKHLEIIREILNKYVSDATVWLFGSRTTVNIKPWSDIDLVIVGNNRTADCILNNLEESFSESDLPVRVDVLDWHRLTADFQSIIKQSHEIIHPSTQRSELPN